MASIDGVRLPATSEPTSAGIDVDEAPEASSGDRIVVDLQPPAVLEDGYRMLHVGDMVLGTDEEYRKGKWRPVPSRDIGWKLAKIRIPRRRKLVPTGFPGLSQEAADVMADAAKAMRELASRVPTESQDHKETGYTVDEVRESQGSSHPTEADLLRFTGMPKTIRPEHPWWPRPFTPNKYTRHMRTLDGRTVPVDVYCVLAAFPTGSAAVDHAIKKQLAAGQRGTKSRLQDLKEARASLDRAIELEEAVDG